MPTKLVLQQRGADGLSTAAELPALENGKIDISQLPVVGESGAAIIARGSNANGEWVRWEDGTQVCYGVYNHNFNTTDVEQEITITFPAAFVNTIISGAAFLNTFPGRRLMVSNYIPAIGTLKIIFWGISGAPSATSTIPIRWFAIGCWK